MQRRLKERLIGAAVLVMIAVIFIPMLLDNSTQKESEITATNIPRRTDNQFSSRIKPVAEPIVPVPMEKVPADEAAPIVPAEQGTGIPRKVEPEVVTGLPPKRESPKVSGQNEVAKEPGQQARPDPPAGNGGLIAWVVQIGSFSSEENARSLNDRARSLGFTSFVEPIAQDTVTSYRVRVGPELLRSDADVLAARLKDSLQVEGIIMQYP